jgi:hypothetical protein
MSKLPIPAGPSEIQRRYMPAEKAAEPRADMQSLKAAIKLATVAKSALTKAQKVKAWREANPEAYAAQKKAFAERRAKKRNSF